MIKLMKRMYRYSNTTKAHKMMKMSILINKDQFQDIKETPKMYINFRDLILKSLN